MGAGTLARLVEYLCDEVIVMYLGHVVERGALTTPPRCICCVVSPDAWVLTVAPRLHIPQRRCPKLQRRLDRSARHL
jgi:hypothetical protein